MLRLLALLVVPVVVALVGLLLVPDAESGATRLVPIAGLPRVPAPEPAAELSVNRMGPISDRPVTAPASRAGSAREVEDEAALEVTLESLSPAVVPAGRRPVTLRGRITNRSDETWSDINVVPCTASDPMTTGTELQVAVESDPEMVVCSRSAYFESIGDLAPAQTKRYTLRVPRDRLGIPEGAEGVYWLNVHALGTSTAGRDSVSDGRARSFVSAVAPDRAPVRTSVLLPVRRPVAREPSGRLADLDSWAADLASGGRLDNLVALAEAAGTGGLGPTLLVDPAVVDAVRQLAADNPTRTLSPEEPEPEDTATGPETVLGRTAQAWLERFRAVARAHAVLALPYGDIDVAATAVHAPGLHHRARRQSTLALDALGIGSTPAIVPPTGLLNASGLGLADEQTVVVLSEDSLPEPYASEALPPAAVSWQGQPIRLFDPGVSLGGPAPGERLGALALRQRILAEAAIRAIGGDERPLLVNPPEDLDPGSLGVDSFFGGLDQRFVDLREGPAGTDLELPTIDEPAYPRREADHEIDGGTVDRVERLVRAAQVLDDVLVEDDDLTGRTAREALSWLSYAQRDDAFAADTAAQQLEGWVQRQLRAVTITAPSFVILSANSGPFPVTVTNGLDQPVELRIRAHTDSDVVIRAQETIALPAGASQTINLRAQTSSIGVHNVTLVATDSQGRPLGPGEEINLRSNQVSRVIWVIMGAGAGILVLAITVRLVRRIRRRAERRSISGQPSSPR